MLGTDTFIASPAARGTGPALTFAQHPARVRGRAKLLLEALPPDLAWRIGDEKAVRYYKLSE